MSDQKPVPPPMNDPRLTELVEVEVLKSFRLAGAAVAVGSTVKIERHLAQDLARLGKCRLLDM